MPGWDFGMPGWDFGMPGRDFGMRDWDFVIPGLTRDPAFRQTVREKEAGPGSSPGDGSETNFNSTIL